MTRTADRDDIRATADDTVRVLDGSGAGGEEVGGKAAALDRLVRWGIPVPAAARVTAAGYRAVARRPEVAAVLARLADGEQVETAAVDAAFQHAGLPGDIAAAVRDSVARIGDGRPVAIRSSATVEDMAASSFAGQYDSVLDVDPHDGAAVEHAVLTVFSSLHHPAPRAYRAALGIPEDGVAMAALVMPMVPALRSGVPFTQDPTAPPGTVRIETVTGLADVLVSGKQTPRVLRLDHGTVPADAAPEVAPLLAAAREIERRAGCPQDVEWAWDGTRIWIVQARPITVTTAADDPFDSPPPDPADRELTTAGIAEMLPGVLPPLRWEVCSFLVDEALRTLLDGLGALPDTTPTTAHGLLRRVHGRAALDAAATGVAQGVSGLPTHSGPAAVRHRLRAAAVRRHTRFDADVAIQASGEIDARARILDCLPPHELLRYQLALIDLATRAMAAEISVATDAGAIHTGLRAVLRRYVPAEQARRLADALVVPERVISASPRASAAIPAGPTWLELGRKPLSPTAVGDRAAAFDQVMTTLEQTERWPSAAVPRWLRHRQIQRLAHEAAEQLERRERAKKAILLLGGEIRRVHLEIGRRLSARGALAEPAEVELLRVRELRPALVDDTLPAPATLAHRRRWLARQEQRDPLPQHFRGVPGPTAAAVPTGRRLTGWAAGSGRFRGTARHLDAPEQSIGTDEVLVAVTTDPSWAPLLMRCGAMVIEQGGPLSHAAILAREFGVPAVFNLPGAARALDGRPVEVDGDTGIVTLLDEGPPMRTHADDRRRAELFGGTGSHIFVPAIMGVGLLFWLASELRELVRTSGDASRAKRAGIDGHAVARFTMGPGTPDSAARRGLRPRPVYLLIAITLLGGALYVTIGSIANFFQQPGWVADIAWLLIVSLAVAGAAVYYGVIAAIVFARYPRPPARWSRALTNSLLTTRPVDGDEWLGRPSWRLGAGFMAATAAAALLSLILGASPYVVEGFDAYVENWFAGLSIPFWTDFTDRAFATPTVLVYVVLVGLAAMRCRALAVAYAAATGFGLLASVTLRVLVDRPRPLDGPMAGALDSYPSGHVIQAVIVAGLVPLAVATLLDRRGVVTPLTLIFGTVAVGAAVSRVADGWHRPTDVLGGAAVGLALVFGARWLIAMPRAHVACRGCPWSPVQHRHPPRGVVHLTMSAASVVRMLAHFSAAAVAVTLAVLTVTVGIPASEEGFVFGSAVEKPAQLALAGVVSVGALLAWRWEAIGAVLIAFAATCLGIFAAIEYQPSYAMALTAGAMVPAVLLWLSWQHRRTAGELVALALVTVLLLATTWFGANRVYAIQFGPTHPDSSAPAPAVDRVDWVWSGALRADGIAVTARLADGYRTAGLRITAADGSGTVDTPAVAAGAHRIVRMDAAGLRPDTSYRYTVVVDGDADTSRGTGRFTTPSVGPMSFRFTAGACARVGSNGAVFDALTAENPLFHLALGDLHYGNIESTETGPFFDAYDRLLTQPGQAAFYRSAPIAYVWDDHDYGPNDAGAEAPGRDASRTAFGTTVPHYAFPSPGGTINQAFTLGRVRFILTDTRSAETDTTMLGAEQLAWLIDEIVRSSRTHALVVWGNSMPWIGGAEPGSDSWAGHPDERARIADAIAAAGVRNLLMVAGDAHMVAIDDGTNSDYSTTGGHGFPVLHAAALDRPGNVKGGPYSEGAYPGGGQYGVVDVADDGRTVTVTLTGKRWDGTVLVDYEFTVSAAAP